MSSYQTSMTIEAPQGETLPINPQAGIEHRSSRTLPMIGLLVVALIGLAGLATRMQPVQNQLVSARPVVLAQTGVPPSAEALCLDPDYTKRTLKTANEMTMVALFDNLHGEKKFEASDVIHVDSHYLVVFDNLFQIGAIHQQLEFRSDHHQLMQSDLKREGDSGFEAIVYDKPSGKFFVVVEAELEEADHFHHAALSKADGDQDKVIEEEKPKAVFHAFIEELELPQPVPGIPSPGYKLSDRCKCDFAFVSGNKGFEGAVHLVNNGEMIMLGLCEGNYCEGGARGRKVGNGRVVLMRKRETNKDKDCAWETINLLALPATAAFSDYSAIAIRPVAGPTNKLGNLYQLAVTSQESSQVWIGELRVGDASDASDWSLTDGTVYNFPRSNSCDVEYCNIEGISFIDDNMLVAVSDKMKSGGRQHYRCLRKDQSIHTFVLP